MQLQSSGQELELVLVGVTSLDLGFLFVGVALLQLGLGVDAISFFLFRGPEERLALQLQKFEVDLTGQLEDCLRGVHKKVAQRYIEEVQRWRIQLKVGPHVTHSI